MSNRQQELESRYFGLRSTCFNYLDTSIKLFKQYLDDELEEDKKSYFELGTKLHMYILEPDKFKDEYIYLSVDKPKNDKQTEFCEKVAELIKKDKTTNKAEIVENIYKTIYLTKKSDSKIKEDSEKLFKELEEYIGYLIVRTKYKDTLSYQDINFLGEAKDEIKNHKVASKLLLDSTISSDRNVYIACEKKIYWEHPLFIYDEQPLVLRSTIDRLLIDHDTKEIVLIDIKTSAKLNEFEESFNKFKYARQMASYWMAVKYYLRTEEEFKNIDWDNYRTRTYIVGIQTPNPLKRVPIECKVYPISNETLSSGIMELNRNLDDVLWHLKNDEWDHSRMYFETEGVEKTL